MHLVPLVIAGTLIASRVDAQERWRQLPGGAGAFAVDLKSLAVEEGVLRARVRARDDGPLIVEEELEIRCSTEQLRTVAQHRYSSDTGRAEPTVNQDENQHDAPWAGYAPGSLGHALLSSLCRLAHDRNLLSIAERSEA